jgi:dephospho-CoA kinase
MFARRGAMVFDADKEVHALLTGKGAAVKAVRQAFGNDLVNAEGVDRVKLAELVFRDAQKLRVLMDIVHPFVKRLAVQFIRAHRPGDVLVLDVPLLIESGWLDLTDMVVVVRARREQQLRRVHSRSGVGRSEALRRIRCQMPLKDKLKSADHCIDNSGSLKRTEQQVQAILDNTTWRRSI